MNNNSINYFLWFKKSKWKWIFIQNSLSDQKGFIISIVSKLKNIFSDDNNTIK